MVNKFVKKSVTVSAIQFKIDSDTIEQIKDFMGSSFYGIEIDNTIKIKTPEGVMTASEGDYIIQGIAGEFYPCKQDIFEKTYKKDESTFLTRMEDESKELEDRLFKLQTFILTDKFESLDNNVKRLMLLQQESMRQYLYSLNLRYSVLKGSSDGAINYRPFETAVYFMKKGFITRRSSNPSKLVLMQVPADIRSLEVIDKTTSLPDTFKELMKGNCIKNKEIKYRNQFLCFDTNTNEATYFCPSTEDLCASDWEIL